MTMLAAIARAAGLGSECQLGDESSITETSAAAAEAPSLFPVTPEPPAEAMSIHKADARSIADAALQYQQQMMAAGHKISAAAAVAAVTARQDVQKAKRGAPAPTPATIAAFYADLTATWKSSPTVQQGFAKFPAYQTSREIAFCREHAIGLEQLRGVTDVPGAFLAKVTPFGCTLSAEAVATVNAAHASWLASPDLRREFVAFEAYAHHVLGGRRK